MLTPADKIANRQNDIIQIVVTNSCDIFNCSNCSQLLPFRKDARFMSLACAEEALKSVQDFPGVVAMFGGNPCTHPQFGTLCNLWTYYLREEQRGLWTNHLLTEDKAAAAKKTFGPRSRFNFNVHGNGEAAAMMQQYFPWVKVWGQKPSHHGMILGSRTDYNVSDEEWTAARESCDINQKWSAGVYAREEEDLVFVSGLNKPIGTVKIQKPYAYFCEVAGSIDGVTGENNGVPATPGWWREPIAKFQRQIDRCCDKHCLVPLRLKGGMDLDDTYQVSPNAERLTLTQIGKARVTVQATRPPAIRELTDYQELRK